MLGGRAAWNVVTSVNDGEAHNMGREMHLAHDLRYDRADEFMEIVLGCWEGWDDDALVVDKQSGLFAHPDKVHRMEYRGKFLTSHGTFTVPRSPQGHPVVIQAGASDRGKRFSARWAETVFVGYPDFEEGQAPVCRLQAGRRAAWARPGPGHRQYNCLSGRGGDKDRGRGQDGADRKRCIAKWTGLSLLSEALNFDFTTKGMDEAFTDEELEGMSGMQAMRDRVMRVIGRNPTVRDFLEVTRRGRPREAIVGGPKEVADRLEHGSSSVPATAMWSAARTCPARSRISCGSSCRNCSGAASSRRLQRRDAAGESRTAVAAAGWWKAAM